VEQRFVSSKTYENLSAINILLPGTVGAPTCWLLIGGSGTWQKSILQYQL